MCAPDGARQICDSVAQSVEQHPFKVMVAGSIPAGVTNTLKNMSIPLNYFVNQHFMDNTKYQVE